MVRVDHSALLRGYPIEGEVCDISPASVPHMDKLLADGPACQWPALKPASALLFPEGTYL
jgi:hypothetical protein